MSSSTNERAPARRIAYLTGRYPTTSHTFVLREIEELSRRGWEVERFSIWRSEKRDLLTPAEHSERARTYSILPLRPRTVWGLAVANLRALAHPRAYARTAREAAALASPGLRSKLLALSWLAEGILLWQRCRRAGISHLHVHLAGAATFAAMLAARFGREAGDGLSWSLTVHGSWEFFRVEQERIAEKVRDARFVICISDYTRSQLMALVEERHWEKLRVVRCGVSTEDFAPARRAERAGRGLRLLTVGRLDPVKGHGVLLEAVRLRAERGSDLVLDVVGGGERVDELGALAASLGIADRVRFRGALSQAEVHAAYSEADVFCLPSFAEGVPIVLMEAMAMEIAVVASRITGIPELVRDGENGLLVRPGRADQLAEALERLEQDELRARLGTAARETVRGEYELADNVRELESVLRGVL